MSKPQLIQIYAFLHAASAIVCRLVGVPDEYILTLLTIMLIFQICRKLQLSLNVTNCAIVFGNLAGYLLGTLLALIISKSGIPDICVYPVSTFVTTEAVGFATILAGRLFSTDHNRDKTTKLWTALAILGVYLTRIGLSICYNRGVFGMISDTDGLLYFLTSFCAMTLLVVIVMIGYECAERRVIRNEKAKRHLAQFRYLKLREQVNPHFLFNSLNALDCLVSDGENVKASEYIHKLSDIYRYMLGHEEQAVVKLSDEIEFTKRYVSLMELRFQDGLKVNFNIDNNSLCRDTVPCSVQLLIENATKHNSIDRNNPLVIDVTANGDSLCVSNNIRPKLTAVKSTGKGLKYIKQQFLDISGKNILIENDENRYKVTLPLL